ncbi:DUF4838 domain-containing protein [Chitinophaga sp. GCM10012297]|uniref:DUF4838 domain-containing protein n=1 Tax=Chitinophaga chungangae TaxID=2821488 RepID=A0ABS3YCH6_9BACT|nr:DUF4838 domain-containing protein [Chitinophaga chungangae]MBO9152392.1 DUF4838 domain-containing protein [Chitinophaga chungangae]
MMNTFFFTLMLFLQPGCHAAKDIVLVENGKARHKIVLPADATPAEKRAAMILKTYLGKISGATPAQISENAYNEGDAAIFIGNTGHVETFGADKLKGEGFLIATDDQHLYIRGGSGKGLVYGVYTLLEQYFGCRKYAAGPAFVPSKKTINIKPQLLDRQEPQFVYRETYYPAPLDAEYQEWHKLHSFEDLWGLWGHSYFKLVPPKEYFSAHPEYFALVNGKRQATQLCLSNEQVFKIVSDYFRKAVANNPDALYWSISPEDGTGYCTCDQCALTDKEEGSHSGSLIRFVNRVAAQFPAQQFTTLAYTYTLQPSARTKPASNVVIMLSSIDAYRNQPLADAPSAAVFRKALADWKHISNNIFVWDYTTQFTNYLAPFPDYFLLQKNLQYFADNGVTGVFSQGSGGTYSDMSELNAYLQANALWQPKISTDNVFSDFMNGYYGPAAPFITKYLEALARNLQTSKAPLDIYGSPVNDRNNYLVPAFIDEYSTLLDQAEKAAGDDAKLLEKVYRARLPLEYAALQQSRLYGTAKYGYLVPSGNGFAPNPKWAERVKRFTQQIKQAGVTELSEGGVSPEAYQQEWEELLARPWKSSLAFRKKVTLQYPFTPEYTAKKEATLTDGLVGGKDFSLNWLFIYGNDLVATIDLERAQKLSHIQLNFLQDARHNIFLPTAISVEVSADGRSFRQVTQQAVKAVTEEDFSARVETFKLAVNAPDARFVRITAKCLPKMPLWRGNDKKPAICCDEVFVN